MKNETHELPQVLGTGVLYNGTGHAFCLVSSSSEPGRVHVVEYLPGGRLTCDCKSYHYRGRCAHVAAVVTLQQRLESVEQAEQGVASSAGRAGEDVVSHVAPASREARPASCSHPGDTAMLRRNNRPFSILK